MKLVGRGLTFHIITLSTYGFGLSGGDRIWIEISKRLSRKYPVNIYLWEEGLKIARREGLKNVNFVLWSASKSAKCGFFFNYFARVVIGILHGLTLNLENSPKTVIYSASEFWQDSFPALILKLRFPKVRWVAAWYQTAPNPLKGFSGVDGSARYRFNATLYWLAQLPIKPIINNLADFIVVNNEAERKQFPGMSKRNKLLVLLGAVDFSKIEAWRSKNKQFPKIYDGVFQGRFHPQKGVEELVHVWKMVVDILPDAKLVMIGDGPLMQVVKNRISEENLGRNIKLTGYVFDGDQKNKIFSQSKVVFHPAFYDSGGMASAEAMAFGIPAIGFDLESYRSYYPKGMLKVKVGDLNQFAKKAIKLLKNSSKRRLLGKEAQRMIKKSWSWDERAERLLGLFK